MPFVADILSVALGKVGRSVGTHPKWYIGATSALSVLLAAGILNGELEHDLDRLFFHSGSDTARAFRFFSEHFPTNYSEFMPERLLSVPSTVDIIFEPKSPDLSVLNRDVLREVAAVESLVRNVTVARLNATFGYEDVCARRNGRCYETATSKLLKMADEIGASDPSARAGGDGEPRSRLYWPVSVTTLEDGDGVAGRGGQMEEVFLPQALGAVVTDGEDFVEGAGFIRSTFFQRADGEFHTQLSRAWQVEVFKALQELEKSGGLRFTNIFYDEDQRLHWKFAEMPWTLVKQRLWMISGVLTAFSTFAFMTGDWVTSKPLLGAAGGVCIMLATAASLGILLLAGVKFSSLLAAVPFLSLGVGMDDAFVVVAAWRLADPKLSVPDRMAAAYQEAAVSITLTTVTDVISFGVGASIPMSGLADFCTFAALAMTMTYLYILVFFGGFLAITGKWEAEGRHCLTLKVMEGPTKGAKQGSEVTADSFQNRGLMMGFLSSLEGACLKLRSSYTEVLHNKAFQAFVCCSFAAYVAGAVYGVLGLQVLIDWRDAFPQGDVYLDYLERIEDNFLEYPAPIQVGLGGDLDYSDLKTQEDIEQMLKTLENSGHFRDSLFTQSWLRGMLGEIENAASFADLVPANISTEASFVRYLHEVYFKGNELSADSSDVDLDGGKIAASRFVLIPKPMNQTMDIIKVAAFLKKFFADNFDYEVHHINPLYIRVVEPALSIAYETYKSLGLSAIGIALVTFLAIGRLESTLYVCVCICSIMGGLMGYSQLMGQNYDGAVMLSMIISVGFSVDYCAHIAFAYTKEGAHKLTSREKLDRTMEAVGGPVVLGAATTFLCITGLINAPAKSYTIFFHILSGMTALGLYHGLIILPTTLILSDEIAVRIRSAGSSLMSAAYLSRRKTKTVEDGREVRCTSFEPRNNDGDVECPAKVMGNEEVLHNKQAGFNGKGVTNMAFQPGDSNGDRL